MEAVISKIADVLVTIQPDDASPQHFYVTPQHHIKETFWVNVVSFMLIYISTLMKKAKITAYRKENPPLNYSEYSLRTVLTINLLLQVIYKAARGWRVLGYMLQPCHAVSAAYLYTLYTRDHRKATTVFNISLHYMFFTALAISVPDLSQLHLPFEVSNFWIQHYVLFFTPLYLLFSGRFPLAPSKPLFLFSIGLGLLFHYDLQLPVALLTGVNVNYMLWPPPGVPAIFTTTYYRVYLTQCFIFLAWVTGYVFPKFALWYQKPTTKQKAK